MATRKTKGKAAAPPVQGLADAEVQNLLPRRAQEYLLPLEVVPEVRFEHLCVELAERQTGIVRAELKRKSGVAQFGVDVEGFDVGQTPVLVISCKRWQAINSTLLKRWSDDFLKHWDKHWSGKGVARFVLAVTVGLNDDDLNAAIRVEAARFAAVGVRYEVWGKQSLTGLLKTNPDLISNYFHPAWKDAIAGYASDPARYALSPGAAAPSLPVGIEPLSLASSKEIAQRYGDEVIQSLESALERFREGRNAPLITLIDRLKQDRVGFDALSQQVKARLLRAEASLAFAREDVAAAAAALAQARHFHEAPDRVGEVHLLHAQGRSADAIALLETPTNQREWELLLALLLEKQGPAALFARLQQPLFADSAETHRLRAIAHTLSGDIEAAILEIDRAAGLTPSAFGVLVGSAIIRFTASLSPSAPRQFGPIPNPIHPGLARDDDRATNLRREAIVILDRLLLSVDRGKDDTALWRLAILVSGKETVEVGIAELDKMVHVRHPVPGAILWALAYGIKFNQRRIRKNLELLLEAGKGNSRHLAALIAIRSAEGQRAKGLKDLDRFADQFPEPGDVGLFAQWRQQLSADANDATAFRDALAEFRKSKDPQTLLTVLSGEGANAEQVLAGAEVLFREGLPERADALRTPLLAIGTAGATELAARAALAAGDGVAVLTITGESASLFPHGQLPHRMRLLEVNAHLLGGEIGTAVRELEALNAGAPDDWTRLQIAKIRITAGDHVGARRVLQSLKPDAPLPGRETLPLAHVLRREAPDIARTLLENTNLEDLKTHGLVPAYVIANDLGLITLVQALTPDFQRLAQDKDSGEVIVFENVEDVLKMIEQQQKAIDHHRDVWLRGQAPLHIAFDREPRQFLAAVFGRRDVETEWDEHWPMLLRAGTRTKPRDPFNPTFLRLDVTAVILAQRLGILPLVEMLAPIRVPPNIAETLTLLAESLDQNASSLVSTIESVLARIDGGELRVADNGRTVLVLPGDPDEPLDVAFAALVAQARFMAASPLQEWLAGFEPRIGPEAAPAKGRFQLKAQEAVRLENRGFLGEFLSRTDSAVASPEIVELNAWLLRCKSEAEQADVLTKARAFVAERLLLGTWQQAVPINPNPHEQSQLEKAGPLLRSLLALVKESRETGTFTWVEDRAASAAVTLGNSAGVDVLDILVALRRAGHLSIAQLNDCRRRLLRYGYGFLPYDIEVIVALMRNAPVRDGKLLETAELTELRRHFALQFDRLRFASPAIRGRDERGDQAELRFSVWHMHFAADVLPQLFADSSSEVEETRLRAKWVWENLRGDQSSFLPLNGDPSPAIRRVLTKHGVTDLITSLLQLQKDTFLSQQGLRTHYGAWIGSRVIAPVEVFDPQLIADSLRDSATQYAMLIPDADPDDAPGLQRAARAIVLRAIDPLPEPWRSRLLEEPALAAKTGLVRELVILLRNGVSFASVNFYRAARQALAGSNIEVQTQDGRPAVFGLDGEGRVTVTLSSGEIFLLSDDDLAVCHPDETRRRAALDRIAQALDLTPAETETLWREIEAESDIPQRAERLQQRQRQSYLWRLQRLRGELAGERNFDKDLMTPPAPREMLRFLCLTPESAGLDQAFAAVSARFGVFEALKRTAGIALPYDAAASRALAEAIARLGEAEQGHAPSQLYALRSVVALARARNDGWQTAARDLLHALESLSGLFLSILRWTARHVLRDPAWAALSVPLRQQLAWLHADLLTGHLVLGNVEPEATAELFDGLDKPGIWRALQASEAAVEEIVGFETEVGLRAWMLGLLCAELAAPVPDGEILTRMRKATALENGEAWIPQIILIARPDRHPPFEGKMDTIAALHGAGVLTAIMAFDSATPDELLERLISEAEKEGGSDVVAMLLYFRFRDIPKPRLEKVLEIARGFAPFRRFALGSSAFNLWLHIFAALHALQEDRDGFRGFLDERIAEAKAAPSQPDAEDPFEALAEAAFQFALFLPGDAKARLNAVLEILDRLAHAWPALRGSLRQTLSGLTIQIAPEHATAVWDLLLKWRRAP